MEEQPKLPLPWHLMKEDERAMSGLEGALALCSQTYGLLDGDGYHMMVSVDNESIIIMYEIQANDPQEPDGIMFYKNSHGVEEGMLWAEQALLRDMTSAHYAELGCTREVV